MRLYHAKEADERTRPLTVNTIFDVSLAQTTISAKKSIFLAKCNALHSRQLLTLENVCVMRVRVYVCVLVFVCMCVCVCMYASLVDQ